MAGITGGIIITTMRRGITSTDIIAIIIIADGESLLRRSERRQSFVIS